MGIIIVRRWDDFKALERIEIRASERYREVGYDPSAWAVEHPEAFARHQVNDLLWVAVSADIPVGFAVADLFRDCLHLEELDVDPAYQRQGIGLSLVGSVIDDGRRRLLSAITLRTFRTTPWSIGLYRRLGFRLLDRHEEPYYSGVHLEQERAMGLPMADRCTMRLELKV